MAKPFKKALTISTCMLVAIACTIGAVAWFAAYKNIGNMGFQTSTNAKLPEMAMWMYYSSTDGATGEGTDTEGWTEQATGTDPSGKNEFITIPSVKASGSGYELKSLHFGKVDNLVTLKNDNKVLLRFYFDESMLNNPDGIIHYVAFTLAYNTAGYTYEEDETSILDSIHLKKEGSSIDVDLREEQDGGKHVLEFSEDNPRAMQFLQIRYAVSTTAYVPGNDGFDGIEGLTFSDFIAINCGSNGAKHSTEYETVEKTTQVVDENDIPVTAVVTDENSEPVTDENEDEVTVAVTTVVTEVVTDKDENPIHAPVCRACEEKSCGKMILNDTDLAKVATKNNGEYTINESGFYVYVELAPLLDAFGMQENILDYFVPAYMFFDVKMDIEIG